MFSYFCLSYNHRQYFSVISIIVALLLLLLLLICNSLYSSLLCLQEVIIPGVIREFWFILLFI